MVSVQSDVIFLFLVYHIPGCSYRIIRLCYKPIVMLPFSLIHDSTQDLAIPNVIRSRVAIIAAPPICMQAAFMVYKIFLFLV
jgi:hypothetical protein